MRLVKDQKVEAGVGEQADVLLTRQEQLELFHVREQDAWLAARCPHHLSRAGFFGRVHALAVPLSRERREVVGARRTGLQPQACDFCLTVRCLADVHAEGNACPRQQPTQAAELVFGQRVHRIDDHRADARGRGSIPELQAPANHRIQKALGLP